MIMARYEPSEWAKIIDHARPSGDWYQPANQDVFVKQLRVIFYPLIKGKALAMAEQAAATGCVIGYAVYGKGLKKPDSEMEKAAIENARMAMELFLEENLSSGTLKKEKSIPERMAFQWPYMASDFADTECKNCGRLASYRWKRLRGDWKVSCKYCGWKNIFRKSWIDREFLKSKRRAQAANAKIRPFSTEEDRYSFYMPIERFYVPEDGGNGYCPITYIPSDPR